MATVPSVYCHEPPPQLYIGVDYRWNPLFFRIPSPRGPRINDTHEDDKLHHSTDRCRVNEQRSSDEMEGSGSSDSTPLCLKMGMSSQGRKRHETRSEGGVVSPRIAQGDSLLRNIRQVHRGEVIVSNGSPHPSLSPFSPDTRSRKKGQNPSPLRSPRTQSTTARKVMSSHPCDSGVPRSPPLTRSAILRREVNTSDVRSKQPHGPPREVANRTTPTTQRFVSSSDNVNMRSTESNGAGQLSPRMRNAAARHPQGHTWIPPRCEAPLTPRGTKAAALRITHAKQRLRSDKRPARPRSRSQLFERTDVVARTISGAMNRWRSPHKVGGGVIGRGAIPPVPEFWEISLQYKERKNIEAKRDNATQGLKDGRPNDASTSKWTSQTLEHLLKGTAIVKECCSPLPADIKQRSTASREKEKTASASIQSDGKTGTMMLRNDESKEKEVKEEEDENEENGLISELNTGLFKESDQKKRVNVALPIEGTDICVEENAMGLLDTVVEIPTAQGVRDDSREHTLPPVDIIGSSRDFSSDAFSDLTTIKSPSLGQNEEQVEGGSDSPSYCRLETLPMVEKNTTQLPPSEINAEEYLSPPTTHSGNKEKDDGTIFTPVSTLPGGFNLSLLSKSELKERMAAIPRYLLLEYAATLKQRKARVPSSTTFHNYTALRRSARVRLLRVFFHKWNAWIGHRTTTKRCASAGHPIVSKDAAYISSLCSAAILMKQASKLCGEEGRPEEVNITTQEKDNVAREEPSAGRRTTPLSRHGSLKENSPPPLSQRLLEEACSQQKEYYPVDQNRAVPKTQALTCEWNSSSYTSSSSTPFFPFQSWEAIRTGGDWTAANGELLDSMRPSTPVNNYAVQEVEGLPSPTPCESLESIKKLSADDSEGSICFEVMVPTAKEENGLIHRIKYLHSEL